MLGKKRRLGASDPQEALDAIDEAERSGLSQAVPTRWFGLFIALISGGIVASSAAGDSQYVALFILALALVIGVSQRRTGAVPRVLPTKVMGFVALAVFIAFAIFVIGVARALAQGCGLFWAPLAGGGLIALIVYALSLSERRAYLRRIDEE